MAIAESRYSVGQGVQQDIYKAGLEKSKLLDMQINFRQQRKSLEANLNYLLYRPGTTPVGKIADFNLPAVTLAAEQLNAAALEKRPQVKSLTQLTHKGEAAHRLAEKEFYPDFNLSFEYMFREASMNDPGEDMFSVGVTFNLPLQHERRQSMLRESVSGTSMATEELNALKSSIGFAVNDSLAQLERLQKLSELYKTGIIPQAEQSLESAVIGYRVNKIDFLTLLDSRMSLYTYELGYCHALADYMMKLAQLEAAIGADPLSVPAVQVQTPVPEQNHHH
jgi:outer membrane protein TolC